MMAKTDRRRVAGDQAPSSIGFLLSQVGTYAAYDARDEFVWTEALGPRPTISDLLSVLLALLEMARRGTCSLTQPAAFSPLVIRRESALPAA